MPSDASTQISENRNTLRYPNVPITAPATGPTMKNDTSANTVYTLSAVPRLSAEIRHTASTPRAGNTSECPNPVSAAPARAIHGECADHNSSTPADSTPRHTMQTWNPP